MPVDLMVPGPRVYAPPECMKLACLNHTSGNRPVKLGRDKYTIVTSADCRQQSGGLDLQFRTTFCLACYVSTFLLTSWKLLSESRDFVDPESIDQHINSATAWKAFGGAQLQVHAR